MSRALTFAYLAEQHPELLPARIVLSLFAAHGNDSGSGDGLGPAIAKMLGFSSGGHGTPGPDGSDGHPNQND